MKLTPMQRETVEAVVSIFETGRLPTPAAYGTATLLADGAGISYGLHQATAHAGSLQSVIREYYARGGSLGESTLSAALEAADQSVGLSPARLQQRPRVFWLIGALATAGAEDARMQAAQRVVFERDYWVPALMQAADLRLVEPLTMLALYDLCIHSGSGRLALLRPLFPERPPSLGGGERPWTRALIRARHAWLGRSTSALVRATTYRTTELLRLATEERWDLARPIEVRRVEIRSRPTCLLSLLS